MLLTTVNMLLTTVNYYLPQYINMAGYLPHSVGNGTTMHMLVYLTIYVGEHYAPQVNVPHCTKTLKVPLLNKTGQYCIRY